jgi:Flp pilus assembly protein TadG
MKTPDKTVTIINKLGNRGIAVIYIALLLVALVAFVGLAIDIGYMYVTKTQLQNAADSAALAGASQMKSVGTGTADPNDLVQSPARTEAISFAAKNTATKVPIVISNDGSNTLSDSNDITVGNWNGTTYAPNITPVNAVQVRPRRTDTSPGGPVSLFIGRVFGQNTMGASADAIAALPLRANSFISFCVDSCAGISTDPSNPTRLDGINGNPPVRVYNTRPPSQTPGYEAFAWTSLLKPVSSASGISPLICTESPNEEVCGKDIYTTQGQVSSLLKDLEAVFNDPNYDRDNKEFSGSNVSAWWVIVPVVEECNPGNQPEPHTVLRYALIRIISACDTGGGNACRPYQSHPCTNAGNIVVDRIACIDCANISNQPGFKYVLVK